MRLGTGFDVKHFYYGVVIAAAGMVGLATLSGLLPAPAFAQGTEQQRSDCIGDAFKFCSSDIPDVAKIEACLSQNRSQLSPACQAEFQPSGRTRLRREHFGN